ncbi:N-acetylmuramic acid 6-phosphate etherase [Halanaerobiaceae bacterium Z-7014]|uniref:N-acetylmuramic acid 6-phosphate etherase n=1 Tax=Halonatronomonas betaini TaxID=2778430 RepID=A0A931FAW5_9FIRM|nr:N-acetylmuramic acid 6-phosphate etherase [Halonatronomonas betaini]MBF8437382.1 N-acetylmuramic acid 6-phosphate etherase [Halonatronomonas betaini]
MNDNLNMKITETRNPASEELDTKSTSEIIKLINEEDATVAHSVAETIPEITGLVEAIVPRMRKGGRIIYVGAGTSGRLGIIDAVECVPTFSLEPGRVVGILAGGEDAMFRAKEGIEDSQAKGKEAIKEHNVNELDTVIGIAASGSTPYVIGAVKTARKLGALTGAVVCNYNSELAENVDHKIRAVVGPEVLTGSTRLKAGTAQKMILNTISTTVMIRLGKVYNNLMVDLKATNAKLRERARGIVTEITGIDNKEADEILKAADYQVKEAIIMIKRGCDLAEAKNLLDESQGDLRSIIG